MNEKRILKNNNEIYVKVEKLVRNLIEIDNGWGKLQIIFDKDISEIKDEDFSFIEENKLYLQEIAIKNELNEVLLDIESINYGLGLQYPSIGQKYTEIKNKLNYVPYILNKYNRNIVTNKFIQKNISIQCINNNYPLDEKQSLLLSKLDLFERLDYLKDICKDIMRLVKHINCNYINVDEEEYMDK